MLKRLAVLLIASGALFLTQGCVHAPYHELEQSLMLGHDGDVPLTFKPGSSFLDPPGTIIFLSREAGIRRLVALARSGGHELSMLYLPKRRAWVTETIRRDVGTVRLDTRYVYAALLSEDEVEIWHTHNNVAVTAADHDNMYRLERAWTVPSPDDMFQLYELIRDVPQIRLHGYIAHIHGVTEYWSDKENWSQPKYIRWALALEGKKLAEGVANIPIADLPTFAENYEGILKIRIRLMK